MEIEKRMALQMDEGEKEKLADFVINNNESQDILIKQLKVFYNNNLKDI